MTDRPASPTFFSSELGNYESSSFLDSSFNFDMNYLDGASPQADGNKSHGADLAMASPPLQGGELSQNTDLSQYFPLPPSPSSPENHQWDLTKTHSHSHGPSMLPDLDGMDFGEQPQPLAAWPGARMEQTLTEFPMRQPSPLTNLLASGNMQTTARGRHGQITPPSDSNPSSPIWKPAVPEPYQLTGGMDSPSVQNTQQGSAQSSASVQRRNPSRPSLLDRKRAAVNSPFAGGSGSAAMSSGNPEPSAGPSTRSSSGPSAGPSAPAPRRRRNQTRKPASAGNLTKEEEEKRAKFLERNRIAASKCRQKKKEWFEQLYKDSIDLWEDGNTKRQQVKTLRNEIIQLKTEILTTNRCKCPGVIDYINREANSITDRYQYPSHSRAGHPDSPCPEWEAQADAGDSNPLPIQSS